MLKIVTIIGARPQFVKAAALSRAFDKCEKVNEILVHTGQHYHDNLSKIFFSQLDLATPKYNLQVGSASQGYQTSQMLSKIEDLLIAEQPDCVLVYGDTNSTLAGALAAVKLHIPIVHVEAGLRSYNNSQPEEVNRILTDRISDLLFVPSQASADNLLKESIESHKIHIVGDIMYDVVKLFENQCETSSILADLNLPAKSYLVATIHRAENTASDNLINIFEAFNSLSTEQNIVIPLHPRTHRRLVECSFNINPAIKIIEPLGFFDMMKLVKNSKLVITDSGGLQKEAFYHKVPCITLREVTEWKELIESGWNVLLNPNAMSDIATFINRMENITPEWNNPYGEGKTADLIAAKILNTYHL
ncbi:MAG: UDP-N-acetylglucosamine 2-epimerase (non-hydrolyzing) [Gammaproteobacteria bacterium]|nr:UDP-N-acetylglucosamine 2-epimerase (non-hydrolyzing) [Gammaproteobacteria bacterium]